MKRDTVILAAIGIVILCLALTAAATACVLTRNRATPTSQSALYTQAASTFVADLTQQAFATLVAQATQGFPTNTPPAVTPTSLIPTMAIPTITPLPPTPIPPSATATRSFPRKRRPRSRPSRCAATRRASSRMSPCRMGRSLSPGRSSPRYGACRTPDHAPGIAAIPWCLPAATGGAAASVRLPKVVYPGENVDIGVDMFAPTQSGTYQGFWMLSNANGKTFGVGNDARTAVWVKIRVQAPNQNFAFDLAANACLATWRSSAGSLPCPGNPQSSSGSVVVVNDPKLEDGRKENEPALWTRPQTVNGGWISGVYPAYNVKAGDHFVTQIGCGWGNTGCELAFTLSYVIGNNSPKSLGRWYEKYEGMVYTVDVDLSSLAGNNVQLILGVENLGNPSQANGFWFVPSVRQVKSPTATATRPAPTPTRTATAPAVTPTFPPDQNTPTPPSPYPYP